MKWLKFVRKKIVDAAQLQTYRVKRKEWTDAAVSNDRNSIWRQICDMLWDDAVYRTFNEACRLQSAAGRQVPSTPSLLLHDLFFDMQCVRIRRLTDPRARNKRRDVYSLVSLLLDMSANRQLIRRYSYVTFDGVPYDERNASDYRQEMLSVGRHSWFDSISGKKPNERSPSDLPCSIMLKRARKHLSKLEDVRMYVNKYVVHAATPASRRAFDLERAKLSLEKLERGYRDLISAAKIIERIIGEYILTEVPVPQFDVLANWDKALLSEDTRVQIYEYWNNRMKFLKSIEESGRLA